MCLYGKTGKKRTTRKEAKKILIQERINAKMKFLLKSIFTTLLLSLMLTPITTMAMWLIHYVPDFMPNSNITVQVIGAIPASQNSRYLEEKTAEYSGPFESPTQIWHRRQKH